MADGNRRIGDWQNRDHDEANTLVGRRDPDGRDPKKWYQRTFWIVAITLVVWPVGLVLVWKSDWHIAFKILASAYVAFAVYFWWGMMQAMRSM